MARMTDTCVETSSPRRNRPRVHQAWWIAAVAGLVVLVTGWSTGVPGMLADPLRETFGWSRDVIGFAFAVNIFFYGLTAPFAAALMDRFGIRRIIAAALLVTVAGTALTAVLTGPWQLVAGWGVLVGLGTGATSLTFAATVTSRWFVARRGLVSGILTAANMLGGMALMPVLAWLVENFGVRAAVVTVGAVAFALLPAVWWVLRDHPGEVGMKAYGAAEFTPAPLPKTGAALRAVVVLGRASKTLPFWLLVGTYGVCGASTNGIMMTYFVPAAGDHGMPVTTAAFLLALMGIFNVVGASGSGWLTDRVPACWLLAACYFLRGGTLVVLPLLLGPDVHLGMVAFAVVYGMLDLATVPPTIALSREFFGDDNGPVVFGWLSAAHQFGAAAMTFLGGLARGWSGSYTMVWLASAALCVVAALMSAGLGSTRVARSS
jgi:MFS family permease